MIQMSLFYEDGEPDAILQVYMMFLTNQIITVSIRIKKSPGAAAVDSLSGESLPPTAALPQYSAAGSRICFSLPL